MPVDFRFEALGEKLVTRRMEGIADRGEDMRPALHKVADLLRDDTRRRFDTQGRGDWPPLGPATVRAKAAAGLDPRVLRATGRLFRSLTVKGDPDQELVVAPRFLIFGTKVDYAGLHQAGGPRLPRRRPLAFEEATKVHAIKTLQAHLIRTQRV